MESIQCGREGVAQLTLEKLGGLLGSYKNQEAGQSIRSVYYPSVRFALKILTLTLENSWHELKTRGQKLE